MLHKTSDDLCTLSPGWAALILHRDVHNRSFSADHQLTTLRNLNAGGSIGAALPPWLGTRVGWVVFFSKVLIPCMSQRYLSHACIMPLSDFICPIPPLKQTKSFFSSFTTNSAESFGDCKGPGSEGWVAWVKVPCVACDPSMRHPWIAHGRQCKERVAKVGKSLKCSSLVFHDGWVIYTCFYLISSSVFLQHEMAQAVLVLAGPVMRSRCCETTTSFIICPSNCCGAPTQCPSRRKHRHHRNGHSFSENCDPRYWTGLTLLLGTAREEKLACKVTSCQSR